MFKKESRNITQLGKQKNRWISRLLIVLLSGLFHVGWAQEPAFVSVGKEALKDVHVYSMVQDTNDVIWISTNQGVVKYDGVQFTWFNNPKLKSNEIFGLALSKDNIIYGFNLGGEIVAVHEDSIYSYVQLPDSLLRHWIHICPDTAGNIMINAGGLHFLSAKREFRTLSKSIATKIVTYHPSSGFSFIARQSLKFNRYHQGKWSEEELLNNSTLPMLEEDYPYAWVRHNQVGDLALFIDHKHNFGFKPKDGTWTFVVPPNAPKEREILSYAYISNHPYIWYSFDKRGVLAYQLDGQTVFGEEHIFKNYMISAYMEDRQGNLWLATFDHGLLFLPNLKIINFNNQPNLADKVFTKITGHPNGNIYVGTDKGEIYQIDTNNLVETIRTETEIKTRSLSCISDRILQTGIGHIDLETKEERFTFSGFGDKDVQLIKEEITLTGAPANLALNIYSDQPIETTTIGQQMLRLGLVLDTIHNKLFWYGERSRSLYYDSTQNILMYGCFKGLYRVTEAGKQLIPYQSKAILANNIAFDGSLFYVATNQGLLLLKDSAVIEAWTVEDGLYEDQLLEVIIDQDYLYILYPSALQRIHLKTKAIQTFDQADGLIDESLLALVVQKNNTIWLLSKSSVQCLPGTVFDRESLAINIRLNNIVVNEEPIDLSENQCFGHLQNRFKFNFDAIYYGNRNLLHYYYRLKGAHEDWIQTNMEQNQANYNTLLPGTYSFEVYAEDKKGNRSPSATYTFTITKPYWQQWWFLFLLLLGTGLLVALFFSIRIRVLKRESQLQLEKRSIEKALVEARQTALRAQMNPHFLFNALNSIQEMIMVNERLRAGDYLGKFADLMRLYLNHSQKNEIELVDELAALELYLDLERVRFEDTLTIDLVLDDQVDQYNVVLPPLLLQPYIENAIKHGLLHKSKNRELLIHFHQKEETLICVIQDNGIGRVASQKINQQRHPKHQSFSTSATQQRLDLFNYNKKHPIKVTIEDLYTTGGTAAGTKVTLSIPLDWDVTQD